MFEARDSFELWFSRDIERHVVRTNLLKDNILNILLECEECFSGF